MLLDILAVCSGQFFSYTEVEAKVIENNYFNGLSAEWLNCLTNHYTINH